MLSLLVLSAGLTRCDAIGPDPEKAPTGASIVLESDPVTEGERVVARAALLAAEGQTHEWLPPWMVPEWSTPDPHVLAVSPERIEAVAPGSALLRLRLGDHSASTTVRVNPTSIKTTLEATVEALDGYAPIAGEDARVRVLLFADRINFFDVGVRARIFHDGTEVGAFDAPRRDGIPVEGSGGPSYVVAVPGAYMQPGASVLVEIETEGLPLVEGSATRYPASGEPMSLIFELISTTMSAYVVQSVQRPDNGVPLVADRDAVVRVFFEANRQNEFNPTVRARLFRDGVEVGQFPSMPRPTGIPTSSTEADLGSSYNIRIPGSMLVAGTSLLVDAELDSPLHAGSALTFPNSGTPLQLDIRHINPFRVRFVPIIQPGTPVGDIHAGNAAQFMALTEDAFPVGTPEVSLREPYHSSASSATDAGWQQILNEVRVLRLMDGDDRYYHGILRRLGSWAGMGYIGYPVAVSWDQLPNASKTVAHEFGHNFARWHAPCGNPGGIDWNYPYPGGLIGVFGLNVQPLILHHPIGVDVMGYCFSNVWVSDYTYEAVLAFRQSEAYRGSLADGRGGSSASSVARRAGNGALLVWGRLDQQGVTIEPAFRVDGHAESPAPGPYRVEGRNELGAVVLEASFDVETPSHAHHGERHFAFTLPADDAVLGRIAELRVTGPGVYGTRSSTFGVAARPDVQPVTARARRMAGRPAVELRWDPERHPLLVVRDGRTGEVIGMLRGGEAVVTTPATTLEIDLSDGVMSVSRRVHVRR